MAIDDVIIAAVRQRLKTKITDIDRFDSPRLKPADPEDMARDEGQLGFALPPLL
jgi:hypothetical protein